MGSCAYAEPGSGPGPAQLYDVDAASCCWGSMPLRSSWGFGAAPDPVASGVEQGTQAHRGRVESATDVHLVLPRPDQVGGEHLASRMADVGQGDAAAQGLAPGA